MVPRPPPREGQLGFVYAPPIRIQGISVAGEQTVVHIPEFDLVFDIGLCPRAALTASVVALAPSYRLAFDTSMPVSRVTSVWYSKKTCRFPWLASG